MKEYEIFQDEISKNINKLDIGFNTNEKDSQKIKLSIENLFEFCYVLDENEVPARYKLKELEHVFTSYNPKVNFI